jgi:hypothetical protein
LIERAAENISSKQGWQPIMPRIAAHSHSPVHFTFAESMQKLATGAFLGILSIFIIGNSCPVFVVANHMLKQYNINDRPITIKAPLRIVNMAETVSEKVKS